MSNTKITYIISTIDKGNAYEWISKHFDKSEIQISYILLYRKKTNLYNFLKENNIKVYHIPFLGKRSYFKSFLRILFILFKTKPQVIHTHFFDANMIGLTAAWVLGIKKRIYTRHHSTFHHENFPKAVKYDKWANNISTHIIAISVNVKNILTYMEKVPESKISLIYHGFKLSIVKAKDQLKIESLNIKYKLNNSAPIVGVIARYINWKGIQYIIPAFKKLLVDYPNAKLVLANSVGPHIENIQIALKTLSPDSYIEIPFENDIFSLYPSFDIYVHVPINKEIEAFGQTYVEALAAGVASIFTLSGIGSDIIKDGFNALVVNYKSSDDIYNKMIILLTDKKLRNRLIANGQKSVSKFSFDKFVKALKFLYQN